MRIHRTLTTVSMLLFVPGLLGGCQEVETPVADEVEELRVEGATSDTLLLPRAELQRARETATALGQDLAGLVFATLEEHGVAAAFQVCSEVAQERTAAHAREGVSVRRVSDRLRNPRNSPDDSERRELERMHALDAEGRLPEEIVRLARTDGERELHLLRPIRIQPGCLSCHGEPDAIAPEVHRLLAELYPDDRASGYSAGQLRGAISVRVPLGGTD
jgi:hypothetical protein